MASAGKPDLERARRSRRRVRRRSTAARDVFQGIVALWLAHGARRDRSAKRNANRYFANLERLIDIEQQHLQLEVKSFETERKTSDAVERRQRLLDMFGAVYHGGIAFAIVGALFALGWITVDAIRSPRVVVDVFDTSPAVAQRGLSGTIVANAMLDQLQTMQMQTRSLSRRLPSTGEWKNHV